MRSPRPAHCPVLAPSAGPGTSSIVLAGLISEGNLCHPTTFYFYTTDLPHRDEFVKAVERFSNTVAVIEGKNDCFSVRVRRIDRARPPEVVTWLKELGMWGCNSHTKFVPAEVFELRAADLAFFLARLWDGDGSVSVTGRQANYDTVSRRLAEEVQHLLLRLGVVSRLYDRERPYRGRMCAQRGRDRDRGGPAAFSRHRGGDIS